MRKNNMSDIPFIANIPAEQTLEINQAIDVEMLYEQERAQRIQKTYANKSSNLRKFADYLLSHHDEELDYKTISRALNIQEPSLRGLMSDLNYYNGFPLTLIPVPNKSGFVQSILKNDIDYEAWDRKKMKTITSMNQVRRKANKSVQAKRTAKGKAKKIVAVPPPHSHPTPTADELIDEL